MTGKDWLWTIKKLIVVLISYFGLSFTSKWLATINLFAPHSDFPLELRPEGASSLKQGVLLGTILKGNVNNIPHDNDYKLLAGGFLSTKKALILNTRQILLIVVK
jgi:hypothetical protein